MLKGIFSRKMKNRCREIGRASKDAFAITVGLQVDDLWRMVKDLGLLDSEIKSLGEKKAKKYWFKGLKE